MIGPFHVTSVAVIGSFKSLRERTADAPFGPAGAWYHLSLFLDDMQLNFAFACVLAGAATAQV